MIMELLSGTGPVGGISLPLLGAVFSASLLGSVHCMGMCGPFVAIYSAGGAGRTNSLRSRALPHLAYHGGRALTYITLGALGGAAGSAIDWAGRAAGLVELAAIVSAIVVVLWGLSLIWPTFRIPSPVGRFLGPQLATLGKKPRIFRASLLGIFTPLLPCGWLYAFVVTAAGTGRWTSGAAIMAFFWLGTVPALVGMGSVVGALSDRLRAKIPLVTGVSLITIGLLGVVTRYHKPVPTASTQTAPLNDGSHGSLILPEGEQSCH